MNSFFLLISLSVFILIGAYFYFFFRRFLTLFPWIKGVGVSRIICAAGALGCIAVSRRIYGFGAVLVLHFLVLGVVMDILQIIFKRKVKSRVFHKWWSFLYRSGLVSAALIVLWMGYGYWNIHQIHRTEYTVSTEKKLDKDFKIVQISDLHMGTTMDTEKLSSILEKIGQEGADMLALTGDIFDESTSKEMMEETAALLGGADTAYGTFYVYGNHDYNAYVRNPNYTAEELKTTLERCKVQVLDDRYIELGQGVTIIGRNDASVSREDLGNLLRGIDREEFLLLLDHQPRQGAEYDEAGIDLQLAGHTHAGQIWPTGQLGALSGMTEQNYGLAGYGTFQRIVSSGIAGWGYAVRTGGHSEYVVVTVKSSGK
ncbi:MAG: metallophosphoesterase [Eubacteriales bacterium]|nr:metallophosphoesterase [Eubacteriales bacterium]